MKNHHLLLLMFSLSAFITPFIGSSLNVAIPAIGEEFNMNVIAMGWVTTAFLLSVTVFLVPLGRLADIVGRKKVYTWGILILTLSSLFCVLAPNGTMLLIGRAIHGFGCAMLFGTSTAILISVFPSEERGKAIGLNVAAVYLGSSVGPVLGGIMTQSLGWRSIFLLTILLGIFVILFRYLFLKGEWKPAEHESFDWIGSVIYSLAIIGMLYGSTQLPAMTGTILLFVGLLIFIAFCLYEDKQIHPIFEIDLMVKNRVFAMSNLTALLNYSAAFALPFLLSLYLQYVKHMDPRQAGLVLLASPIMMMIGSPFAGRLSDRIEPGIVASIGMGLTSFSLLFLAVMISIHTGIESIVGALLIFGTGLSLFSSPNTNSAMGSLPPKYLGVGSSVLSTMRTFGQMLSMAITMLILTLVVGKVKITPEILPLFLESLKVMLTVFGILSFLGIFTSLSRAKR